MLVAGTVEGGANHLTALQPATHVGDLLGPFVDQQDNELHLGVVGLDRPNDRLHDRGFASLGGRHDHPALALSDRREQVDDPSRHIGRVAVDLHTKLLVGEQRGEVFEPGPVLGLVRVLIVDLVDSQQGGILLAAVCRARRTHQVVTPTKSELADLLNRDIGVLLGRLVTAGPQEPIALVAEVEVAFDIDWLAIPRLLGPLVIALATPTAATAVTRLGFAVLATLAVAVLATLALAVLLIPAPTVASTGLLVGSGITVSIRRGIGSGVLLGSCGHLPFGGRLLICITDRHIPGGGIVGHWCSSTTSIG